MWQKNEGILFEMITEKEWGNLSRNVSTYQYIGGEYMLPEEYDSFIKDPFDFLMWTISCPNITQK